MQIKAAAIPQPEPSVYQPPQTIIVEPPTGFAVETEKRHGAVMWAMYVGSAY
jgi:hypothetical protein